MIIYHYTRKIARTNAIRHANRHAQGAHNKSVRNQACREMREVLNVATTRAKRPHFVSPVWLACYYVQAGNRTLGDYSVYSHELKAIVDGCVDAGLIRDDSPKYLRGVMHFAPQHGENSGLWLVFGECLAQVLEFEP